MKKYIGYIATLLFGLAIGALIWSGGEKYDHDHEHDHAAGTEWTCSMHPQIRQSKPGLCPLCGMDLTPAVGGSGSSDPIKFEMSSQAIRLAAVRTQRVGYMEGGSTGALRLNARIMEQESAMIRQVTHIPGRLEQLFVNYEGQQVSKGARIARIYSPELVKAQQELRIAGRMDESVKQATVKKLRQWKLSDAQINQILSSPEIVTEFDIYADQGGTVTMRMMQPGNYVKPGEVLYEAINLSSVWLVAEAYEKDLVGIRLGSSLKFTAQAFPGKVFEAKVDFIDPFLDPMRRTARVRATLPNREGLLKPEMLGIAELISASASESGLMIPRSAILWTGTRSILYVADADVEDGLSFSLREVMLGERVGDHYRVLEGLEAGEEIVVNGTFSVDAAAQLAGKASMMNPARALLTTRPENKQIKLPNLIAKTNKTFKSGLYELSLAYIKLKDELVEAKPGTAQTAAQDMGKALASFKAVSSDGEVKEAWETVASQLKEYIDQIASERNLDKQRQTFIDLSNLMIASVRSFGIAGGTLYLQNCPMANNDLGADWLALESNIRNPYYGSLMMTCGTVEGEFKSSDN
jgi:Cu(I)/Ag(I) efflux system membrane fusion protein